MTTRLSGTITSSQIEDGTITTTDLDTSSFSNWDQNALDDLTTSTDINSISGTLSDSKIDAAITRDSEVVSLADPSFTTDAESASIADQRITNAINNNTIPNTAAEIGASPSNHNHDGNYSPASHNHDASYSPLSHNHDTSYASLSHGHDSSYVNVTGDTMTGSLNMGGNNVTNAGNFVTNNGYNINSHETRITALEGGVDWDDLPGDIPDSKVPRYMRPVAFGTITGNTNGSVSIVNSYNIGAGSNRGSCLGGSAGFIIRVNFTTTQSNANYIVLLSPGIDSLSSSLPGAPQMTAKTSSYFEYCYYKRPVEALVFRP